MCFQETPEGISTLRLNSELRDAHLEVLSAHCAVHQLRLNYSLDDLARLGRTDLLRQSAAAATAVSEFYAAVGKRIPGPTLVAAPSADRDPEAALAVEWLSLYLQTQRERYYAASRPLDPAYKSLLAAYFSPALLDRVRVVELHGERVPLPDLVVQARARGFENLPDIPHMESLTFVDVVVFNEKLTERALFHALVHAVQIQILGLDRYAEFWIRSFLDTRAHFTVALEVHAFSLASRFSALEKFSTEEEVLHWVSQNRY